MEDSPKKRRPRTARKPVAPRAKDSGPQPGSLAESELLNTVIGQLTEKHGCQLVPTQFRIDESFVKVGAMNLEAGLAFEVHPKPGPLNSGVKRRICQDVLKLGLVKDHFRGAEGKELEVAIVLGDAAARDSFSGITHPTWMRRAADLLGVKVLLVGEV